MSMKSKIMVRRMTRMLQRSHAKLGTCYLKSSDKDFDLHAVELLIQAGLMYGVHDEDKEVESVFRLTYNGILVADDVEIAHGSTSILEKYLHDKFH